MSDDPDFVMPRICVLTIQGGGALGVELIGQLKGVTGASKTPGGRDTGDLGFGVVGIAGSSAGAIIATLYWAGYEPRDILSAVKENFSEIGRERFFGPIVDGSFKSFDELVTFLDYAEATLVGKWEPRYFPRWLSDARRRAARLILCAEIFLRCRWVLRKKGLLAAEGFEAEVDKLLRQAPKLQEDLVDKPGPITFRDVRELPKIGMVPLFLMVTDVAAGGLKIVSSIDDDMLDVPISRAVRASAGFPLFFRPVELNGKHPCCVDGGLISNVPTWVFNRTLRNRLRTSSNAYEGEGPRLASLAALPWYHISLRLGSDAAPGVPAGGAAYARSLWRLISGIGRRQLEETMSTFVAVKRFAVRPEAVAVADHEAGESPEIQEEARVSGQEPDAAVRTSSHVRRSVRSVLDFKALADPHLLDDLYNRGRMAAHASIDEHKLCLPPAASVLLVLQDLVSKVETALGRTLVKGSRVRANVFLPKAADVLKIAYACNMEGHLDAGTEISQGQGVTSLCYIYSQPFLANLADKTLDAGTLEDDFRPFATPTSPDRNWLMCVPILDPLDSEPQPHAAGQGLAMDSQGPIFGTLNIDANVIYGSGRIDPDPFAQSQDPLVRLIFDATRTAAYEVGMLFNQPWLESGYDTVES